MDTVSSANNFFKVEHELYDLLIRFSGIFFIISLKFCDWRFNGYNIVAKKTFFLFKVYLFGFLFD